jgi:riboflavin kinase/FMN adenylyltransferase
VELSRGAERREAGRGGLVVIGNFDGVHRGHQALIADAAAQAEQQALAPMLLTFDPHPAKVLGRTPPPALTDLPRKLELITRIAPGMQVVVIRFDREFAALSPEQFAERVLVDQLAARVVIVGQNFRFGKDRKGDFAALVGLGGSFGFETRSYALMGDESGPWSSTRAREAVARADLGAISRMLGRPHMLSGTVVEGDRRGRTLGFPTCNLDPVTEALPPHGVYAVVVDRVLLPPGGKSADAASRRDVRAEVETAIALGKGVANIGVRPTVRQADPRTSVEVHLLDHDEQLYGAKLRVHLIEKLRPEQRFPGLDALKAQIEEDAKRARIVLSRVSADPAARGAWF